MLPGDISFSPLDYECQIKYFPDLDYQFTFVNDKSKLLEKLKSEFPHESKKIDIYFKYLRILEKKSGMFSLPKMYSPAIAKIMFGVSRAFNVLPHMDKSVTSFLLLLVGFKGDISSFGVKKSAYKTIIGDPSTMSRNPTEKGWVCDDVTISFPSLLDKEHRDPNYHMAEIHHETRYEYFEKYEGKQNSDEYKQITEQITKFYLNHLNEKFPGIIEYVKYSKLITPLDVKNLTHHINGSMFGLDIQKADNPELSPRSGMKNLFFTGEDIFSHGLSPLNGVITASVVTGKNLITRFKKT